MDRHSREVEQAISSRPRLWFTPLHKAEWVHAIEQHVFRRQMSRQTAYGVYTDFERDASEGFWTETPLPANVFERAIEIARTYVAQTGTRTLDTLHVAAALELRAERFWTFDDRQAKLAKAVGLKVK
jgi:predicted nucleic acid-binding protein